MTPNGYSTILTDQEATSWSRWAQTQIPASQHSQEILRSLGQTMSFPGYPEANDHGLSTSPEHWGQVESTGLSIAMDWTIPEGIHQVRASPKNRLEETEAWSL